MLFKLGHAKAFVVTWFLKFPTNHKIQKKGEWLKKLFNDHELKKTIFLGNNPDLMAEMKEKRASMAPHKLNDEESVKAATEKPNPNAGQTGMFSGVKLR